MTAARYRAKSRIKVPNGTRDPEVCMRIICDRLASSSMGLHKILSEDCEGLPSVSMFWKWLRRDDMAKEPKGFSLMYAHAKRLQAEFLESEILGIADALPSITHLGNIDGGDVAHMTLRINTRKWLMAKLHSEKYGDKTTLSGDPERPLSPKTDLSKLTQEELTTLLALRAKIDG